MLQINPTEIIKNSKLLNDSLNIIDTNLKYFKGIYTDKESIDYEEVRKLEKLANNIRNSSSFLNQIVNELEKVTGEAVDSLLEKQHSMSYYENILLSYYAKAICNNDKSDELSILDLCYGKDEKLTNYCSRENFITYYSKHINDIDFEKYGLTKEEVEKELLYIFDKRGANEAHAVLNALMYNAPNNYTDYHFSPSKPTKDNKYYDFNDNVNNYATNSETIDINGYSFEITQVLPQDCTKTEELVYNFAKANVINTMKTLPDKYLNICSQGNSNSIILTSSRSVMKNSGNWSGYYKSSSLFGSDNQMIVIDAHGSLIENEFYTQDTIIHEMGHKFDDIMYNKNIFDRLFGRVNYTSNNKEWQNAYNKYKSVLNSINLNGYDDFPNVNEFFGDTMVAYFKNPKELSKLCPEVYNLVNNMLDGEYGYSYDEKIIQVLNVTF